jgi:hypothetical protein
VGGVLLRVDVVVCLKWCWYEDCGEDEDSDYKAGGFMQCVFLP